MLHLGENAQQPSTNVSSATLVLAWSPVRTVLSPLCFHHALHSGTLAVIHLMISYNIFRHWSWGKVLLFGGSSLKGTMSTQHDPGACIYNQTCAPKIWARVNILCVPVWLVCISPVPLQATGWLLKRYCWQIDLLANLYDILIQWHRCLGGSSRGK